MTTCVITGCALSLPDGSWVWGDLFQEGDCWVFNASNDPVEETITPGAKILSVLSDEYFERRRVYVIKMVDAHPNRRAADHMRKWT